MGRRDVEKVWDQYVHSTIFEMDNQQGPTIQHRELCSVMWQPGWEGSLRENAYMYMYG